MARWPSGVERVGPHQAGPRIAAEERTVEPRTTSPWLSRAPLCEPDRVNRGELADFLRRRREALRPDQVPAEAVHPPGRRARRTPGLRREEVAALAGVSISYYERLEQARAPHPSPQVLASLARALRLTAAERDYLARLAGQVPSVTDADGPPVSGDVRQFLDRLGPIPAYLADERLDILAWNSAAAELIIDFGLAVLRGTQHHPAGHPAERHTLLRAPAARSWAADCRANSSSDPAGRGSICRWK
ncbi:helix-turn-helix domain-containing protein [Streptomyces sp. 21So2-11]|uniref:helix-turn-helix domain-containing protein n=1 Tax=Streptomyces sp. 21So2-11 TaxID=3144408 RepID=UPI00321B5106